MFNKKAQTSETITWVVASLIIIAVLLISIFFASSLGSLKTASEEDTEGDWIEAKTEMALSINDDNEEEIKKWISEENDEE